MNDCHRGQSVQNTSLHKNRVTRRANSELGTEVRDGSSDVVNEQRRLRGEPHDSWRLFLLS